MGVFYTTGTCWTCQKPFSFNPALVPSHPDENGIKQPICLPCITMINKKRAEAGKEQFPILPGAYDPMTEAQFVAYMDEQDRQDG